MGETTEILVDERGDETHESWLLIRANRVSSTGSRLFDSEIRHQQFVTVTITRCRRHRSLHHDRFFNTEVLLEMDMSMAQWGAFVSSFGDGSGVPATLSFLAGVGRVPSAPEESRLAHSVSEVRGKAEEAFAGVQASFRRVEELFEAKAGRRQMAEAIRDLHFKIQNAPSNVEFAAKSLSEHAENVVTKARADVEGMVTAMLENAALEPGELQQLLPGGEGR